MVKPLPKPRFAAFRTIRHPRTGEALDKAVVLWFEAPSSETGEDVAEFQVHGSRAVIRAVLAALGEIGGCRLAEPGEFARRAFENGKLDLAEVEGLADLVEAETEAQRRQALAQAGGALSKLYEGWRTRLIEIAALTEAAIDFSDEGDVSAASFAEARERAVGVWHRRSRRISTTGTAARSCETDIGSLCSGRRMPANRACSTLLPGVMRRSSRRRPARRATSSRCGSISAGLPVIVSDTAGIREATSVVEQEGIRRSLAAARDADLVLWLSETGEANQPPEFSRETSLVIRSKADLASESSLDGIAVSAVTGAGLDRLIEEITRRAELAVGSRSEPALTQARHRQSLQQAAADIEAFLRGSPDAIELRAEDVRRAAHAIGRITGRVDVEDVLDQIFSRFCIGK